jgi:arylsulfatase A-like enzyme
LGVACRIASLLLALGTASACGRAAKPVGPASAEGKSSVHLPDIVIIAVDNVRWDHTGIGGYERNTTPILDAFAALPGSVTFRRAYTAASWSQPSYASIFTGRNAVVHGAGLRTQALGEEYWTLAEILSAWGYETAAFVGGMHVAPWSGLAQGFASYQSSEFATSIGLHVDQALDWERHRKSRATASPQFVFVHGYDAHIPMTAVPLFEEIFDPSYDGPDHTPGISISGPGMPADTPVAILRSMRFQRASPGKGPEIHATAADQAHFAAHYDAAILYADAQLGRLLGGLDTLGVLDSAIVVVLADHGEDLGEWLWFHHDSSLGDHTLHVPLVVHFPSSEPARSWDGVVSLVDLLPSLLHVAAIPPPVDCDGQDVFHLLPPSPGAVFGSWDAAAVPAERAALAVSRRGYAVRSPDWLLTGELPALGGPFAWALRRDGKGPDVAESQPEVFEQLRSLVASWPAEPSKDLASLLPEDSVLREALRQGGYWRPDEEASKATPSPAPSSNSKARTAPSKGKSP